MAGSRIEALLEGARAHLHRVGPADAAALAAGDGVLIDIRPAVQRAKHGEIPGAVVVERNVLEWRLDPTSPHHLLAVDGSYLQRPIVVVCQEGYASSFAAASSQALGLAGATDLDGGFEAWAAAGLPVAPPDLPAGEHADI